MKSNTTRSGDMPDRAALEHRFTDTPDGTLAGTWWPRNSLIPWCEWRYDAEHHRITVTRATRTRTAQLPASATPRTEGEQRKVLPLLALHLARDTGRTRHSPTGV